jgi:hypothetical protein
VKRVEVDDRGDGEFYLTAAAGDRRKDEIAILEDGTFSLSAERRLDSLCMIE